MVTDPIFHIAFPVNDLDEARAFYVDLLGCTERPEKNFENLAVLNFFGARLVVVDAPDEVQAPAATEVPSRHFGIIMDWDEWHDMAAKLKDAKVDFVWGPKVTDHENIGEVGSLFINDPSGNSLEFKSYKDKSKVL